MPFMVGLTMNRYIGRTFIQPDQRLRHGKYIHAFIVSKVCDVCMGVCVR